MVKDILSGSHPFSKRLGRAKKPLIILGVQQLKRKDGAALLALVQQLAQRTAQSCKVSYIRLVLCFDSVEVCSVRLRGGG